jgi:hypothetical protein
VAGDVIEQDQDIGLEIGVHGLAPTCFSVALPFQKSYPKAMWCGPKKFAYIKSAVASATIWQQCIKSYVSVTQRLFRATDAMDDLPIHRHLGGGECQED